jgi:flavin-dependent dehydrogenase
VVPRLVFDDRLLRAARSAGATVRRRRVRSLTVDADGVVLDGELRARAVVGADGAESVVRRGIGVPAAAGGTVALAIRGYAPADPWPAAEQLLTMTAAHWPAYAWVFPIGDGRANVGYGELLRGEPVSRAHLLRRLAVLLPEAVPTGLRAHRLPLSTGRPEVGHGPVLLAGDAAALINPITGEGIFYAVLSGTLAGAAALTADPATEYRRALRRRLGRHLRHTDALARLGRWPALLDAGIDAAARRQEVFDTVVELGLGDGRLNPRTVASVAGALAGRLRRGLTTQA